jgi:hypothetical protein
MSDVDALYSRVERALADESFANDQLRYAMVWIGFCDLIAGQLDNEQRAAVEDARLFWSGGLSEPVRLETLERMAGRLSALHREGDGTSPTEARMRLVWGALVTDGRLDVVAGEYLVGLGERAGLTAEEMSRVFAQHLPSF